ncbi:MAG: hypothetical protein P8Y58_10000 [Novosphingobium sp.]|jgi:hypothetical protein
MNDTIAKGLEGALMAAVESNGGAAGSGNGGAAASDLMSLAAKVLPKLLDNSGDREDQVELEKENVFVLRKEMRLLRRQLRELVESHKAVLEELSLMRELHSAMVSHLARVQILEMPDDEEFDYEFEEFPDGYDYADDLVMRSKQRGGGSQGQKRMKNHGPRNPRPR